MGKITDRTELGALADNDLLYVRDTSDPANPDKKMTGAIFRVAAADLSGASAATPADDDRIGIWDVSDGAAPRKYLPWSAFRPTGSKITHHYRFSGNIAIPNIAADSEQDASITVTGAAVGDHVVFNPTSAPPAGLVVAAAWVSAADTVSVRFRNVTPSTAFVAANLACVVLVSRSTA